MDGSRPGYIKIGKYAKYYSVMKVRQLLVSGFSFPRSKADLMCVEVGLDRFDDAALCPCASKKGHRTPGDEFHKFPRASTIWPGIFRRMSHEMEAVVRGLVV